jgi:uridylate kinase
MATPVYSRVVLKLSGEALMGEKPFGLDRDVVASIAEEVCEVHELGVETSVVIGGGNVIRGMEASEAGIDRVTGDHMGMLATVINALAFQDAMEQRGVTTRVQTAIQIRQVAEEFIRRRAIRHLEKRRVVIFAGGTGSPFFTTDSAAALRANEIRADALLKATKVDGIYTADPMRDAKAERLKEISYQEVLSQNLRFMDAAAVSLCRESSIPIVLFDMTKKGNVRRVVCGEDVGSVVR